MHTLIRKAGTAMAGVVLAGAGLLVALPATSAHAASSVAAVPEAAPAAACTHTARGWICFLRYCDDYYCYYDCYPPGTRATRVRRPPWSTRFASPKARLPSRFLCPDR